MGFLSKFFGSSNQSQTIFNKDENTVSGIHSLNLDKETSLTQLNLRKEYVQSLCLKKSELNGLIARVCMVMDFSGSMDHLYYNGGVQEVLEKLLPIAMQFDDNGVMEAWIFSNKCWRIPEISLENYYDYIKNNKLIDRYEMGGTEYAPVMQDVVKKYIQEEPADIPTLVLFITDGDNSDKDFTTKVIREASKYPVFWQFVGIGNTEFHYLEKLDQMSSRFIDNANFFAIEDINNISDNELYEKLLAEYPDWIKKAKNARILK